MHSGNCSPLRLIQRISMSFPMVSTWNISYLDPGCEREPTTLVVSGKMSYHANITMVLKLFTEIMPLIWQQKPDVRVWIVGKDPPKELQALEEPPRVVVTGYVPDIRPYLRAASIALAPLTYGAGIQNKVLEAMACGTPVVSTPLAMSGLETATGAELMVAGNPSEFSQTYWLFWMILSSAWSYPGLVVHTSNGTIIGIKLPPNLRQFTAVQAIKSEDFLIKFEPQADKICVSQREIF